MKRISVRLAAGFFFLAGIAGNPAEMEVTDRLSVDGASLFKSAAVFSGGVGIGTPAVSGARLAVNGSTETAYVITAGTSAAYNFVVSTTGNVGIGTANPGQKLSVAGTIETAGGGVKFPDGSLQTSANPVVVTLVDVDTVTVDASSATVFNLTLAGNRAIANTTNLVNGRIYTFRIYQDATGGHTLTWGDKYLPSGMAVETSPNGLKVFTFSSDGTTLYNVGSCSKSTCVHGSQTFTYTGSDQTFTIPNSCILTVKLWGAGGGGPTANFAASGGGGGYARGDLNLSSGGQLTVIVGGGGGYGGTANGTTPASYGGGGSNTGSSGGHNQGAGGGRSAVRYSSTELLTAGGGGGAAGWNAAGGNGGAGGGLTGGTGGSPEGGGGGGGTQSSGGSGGNGGLGNGTDGTQFTGGNGGGGQSGGGGGGGYYGGGGGGGAGGNGGGGGGGSSYVGGAVTGTGSTTSATGSTPGNTDISNGYVAGVGVGGGYVTAGGNGLVVISW